MLITIGPGGGGSDPGPGGPGYPGLHTLSIVGLSRAFANFCGSRGVLMMILRLDSKAGTCWNITARME